jgi:allophanate hydrolase
LNITALLAGYRSGRSTPSQLIAELIEEQDRGTYANAWICRVDQMALMQRAREVEELARSAGGWERLPLYGVPFAVKDNIDVQGLPTTAGCAAFAYVPQHSALAVQKLEAAGAILLGKTNLDQFATGLVGSRSPYGTVANTFRAEYISGGSSSGSAVVVARGEAAFALGTDTAGSGRVPAGLNNLVGLKPTRGLVSARGMVPACQSLDCMSIFALTVPDAVSVLDLIVGYDQEDPYSRRLELWPATCPPQFRFAVPEPLEFYGDELSQAAFARAADELTVLGGRRSALDFSVFSQAASLLYEGPWVAERLAGIRSFFEQHAEDIHPVVRQIIGAASKYSAADLFAAATRLHTLRKLAAGTWEQLDVIVVPTAPTVYTIEAVHAEPFGTNSRLGRYTNFVNLLDLAAIAVPASIRPDGLPFGITLIGPAGSDRMLADLAQRFHQRTRLPLGATQEKLPPPVRIPAGPGQVKLAVVGAHLSGLPLNHELTQLGARLERAARTAPRYRLFALPGTKPPKPGMMRVTSEPGYAIELEVWTLAASAFGAFVAGIPSPLGIGRIELEDGEWVQGFVCESWALSDAQEVSKFGGWRAYMASLERR